MAKKPRKKCAFKNRLLSTISSGKNRMIYVGFEVLTEVVMKI
jgi:hypothetical protein